MSEDHPPWFLNDREWFAGHPDRNVRLRVAFVGEVEELCQCPDPNHQAEPVDGFVIYVMVRGIVGTEGQVRVRRPIVMRPDTVPPNPTDDTILRLVKAAEKLPEQYIVFVPKGIQA
jgi:hypothetical protein